MGTKQHHAIRSRRWIGRGVATLCAAILSAGCAGVAAPGPEVAPREIPPTSAAHTGQCYNVTITGWGADMASRASHLEDFDPPTVVYLHPGRDHEKMTGTVSTGSRELLWSDAREARWIADGPYRNGAWPLAHAHWWQGDDARYHIGFAGSDEFWVGFEAIPTTTGMEGIFRYWSREPLGEASEPMYQATAQLRTVDCVDTPMVIFE